MTARKKIPEFELPTAIIGAASDYIGPQAVNALTPKQRTELATVAYRAAQQFGAILYPDPGLLAGPADGSAPLPKQS